MGKRDYKQDQKAVYLSLLVIIGIIPLALAGCNGTKGYSNESLFPENINSVCVQMFDNKGFRRGIEYTLTDALAKSIDAKTPYKVISDKNIADTILTGYISSTRESVFTVERETGRALEKDVELFATVNWKNLKTGEMLLDDVTVSANASYSEWQSQGFEYGSSLAANRLAKRIVELMEKQW